MAEKNLRQSSVAEVLHLSSMAISRRLTGTTPLTAAELIAISQLCGVPVATFFGEFAAQRHEVAV